MSNPDFRQPDPAASLTGALGAQRKLAETMREEADRVRRDDAPSAARDDATNTEREGEK